jgi:hypothetical protein
MFGKKKKEPVKVAFDYTKWESDLGFLTLIITRKINIAKEFNLKILGDQMTENNAFIGDKDITELYQDTTNDIYDSLSDTYKTYLIEKYFGTDKAFIAFIAETVIEELIVTAIDKNNSKIKTRYSKEMVDAITELNKKSTAKKEEK